jgi:hypothetical protein
MVWATVPYLPFELWHEEVFKEIGKRLGKFIVINEKTSIMEST